MTDADICIIGGGPAGMVAGLLFARAGLRTVVLEKHADFLRDFRGDTVHPSTLRIFSELGLLDELLLRPHQTLRRLSARIAGQDLQMVDMTHLDVPAPYVALMPQWDFLDFVADAAARYPTFELRQSCAGTTLIEQDGRVCGGRTSEGNIRARLTIAADGRDSTHRAGLPATVIGAPMDVFWFRIHKPRAQENETMGVFDTGTLCVMIDRSDYYQCACVFAKGDAGKIKAQGLDAFRDRVRRIGPEPATVAQGVTSWDDVKLLTVPVDRLETWDRPGLLVIGDAAPALSPIGGVGINLAVQDAVAAANILAAPVRAAEDPAPLLHKVRDRRIRAVKLTQGMQRLVQDTDIAPLLASQAPLAGPPLVAKLFDRIPLLRRNPARVIGMGFRPAHVRSPEARFD